MSIQRQLLYPNHNYSSQLSFVFLVVIGWLLRGLVFLSDFSVTKTSGSNLVISTETELPNTVSKSK